MIRRARSKNIIWTKDEKQRKVKQAYSFKRIHFGFLVKVHIPFSQPVVTQLLFTESDWLFSSTSYKRSIWRAKQRQMWSLPFRFGNFRLYVLYSEYFSLTKSCMERTRRRERGLYSGILLVRRMASSSEKPTDAMRASSENSRTSDIDYTDHFKFLACSTLMYSSSICLRWKEREKVGIE